MNQKQHPEKHRSGCAVDYFVQQFPELSISHPLSVQVCCTHVNPFLYS
jgi:hypothetical protein